MSLVNLGSKVGEAAHAAPEHQPQETIYFARPSAQYRARRLEIDEAMQRVLDGDVYIMGEEVRRFEEEFAEFTGATYAIGVANGTDALHLSLRALGIGPGDEVITTAHTAVATAAAIEMAGATPRFVDIENVSYGIDPEKVEAAITKRTRAIMPVHLYGHPVEMGPLLELAERYGLEIVEDCAQAHGAVWNGRQVGTIGRVGCFSLYPTKNLGALGDAGVIIASDARLAENLRQLRQYGWRDRQSSEIPGWNSRLDELQAAVLRVKLRYLAEDNAKRRAIAARYTNAFSDLPLIAPTVRPGCEAVFHLYVLRARHREEMKSWLAENNIVAGIHYPVPVHRQPAYIERFGGLRLPVVETIADQILSLPIYPELRDDQVERVIDSVRKYHRAEAAD
jgi:dTDP-4-amino-4,6-dideoxygalactose transaminase